jgi:hypothetical protein
MQSLFTILFFWFLDGAYIKINIEIEKDMHVIWKTVDSLREIRSSMPWPGILAALFDVLDSIGILGAEFWNIWWNIKSFVLLVILDIYMYCLKMIPVDYNLL